MNNRVFGGTLAYVVAFMPMTISMARAADTSPGDTLEEVVITAEKRSENMQTVPLAVSVLTADDLARKGVQDFRDLQNATPSLSVTEAGILTFMNIRGIGLTLQSPTVVSGVATYRDGLFSPSPIFMTENQFDLASVEVLRGPQGTFVGQNSTAGAVFLNSQNPALSANASGYAGLHVGSYNEHGVTAAVNLPVSGTVAARIAINTESRDSYYTNIGSRAATPGSIDHKSVRLGLLWQPSESFQLLWKTEANDARDGGYSFKPQPGGALGAVAPVDPFTLNFDRSDIHDNEGSVRSSVEARWKLQSGLTIKSLTGYQLGTQNFLTDTDATNLDLGYSFQRILDKVYSQELDVVSPDTGSFKWTVGGSYVRQDAHLDLHICADAVPLAGSGNVCPHMDIWILTTNPKISTGAFAQGTLSLGRGLELQAGARFSHDSQSQEGALTLTPSPPLPGAIPADSPHYDDNHVTGKVALNWTLNPHNFLYAFVANGFKSGGVNLPAGTFRAETVRTYEAGWKGTFADGHVRTQLGVFDMDYHYLQMNIVDPNSGTNAVGNADKSTVRGTEFQLQSRFGGLGADLNVAYLDSTTGGIRLIDVRSLPGGSTSGLGPQCVPGQTVGCFDYEPYKRNLAGQPTPYSPKVTANLGLEYRIPAGNGSLTPRLDVSHIAKQYSSLFAGPLDTIPARTVGNVSLYWEKGNWLTTVSLRNVTDKTYVSGIDDGSGNMWLGAPRTFQLSVRSQF